MYSTQYSPLKDFDIFGYWELPLEPVEIIYADEEEIFCEEEWIS